MSIAVSVDSFTASPPSITQGQSVVLSWHTTNATKVELDNGIGDVTGLPSFRINSLNATNTYTLTASGPTGQANYTLTVKVTGTGTPPPPPPSATVESRLSALESDMRTVKSRLGIP